MAFSFVDQIVHVSFVLRYEINCTTHMLFLDCSLLYDWELLEEAVGVYMIGAHKELKIRIAHKIHKQCSANAELENSGA